MKIKKEERKQKNISQYYQVGDFIDAKDNQGDWRVGYIVDKSDIRKTFNIRFDGWPSKYDECYRFEHPKLRQFRSIVIGYTGQKQLAGLRPGWKFTLPDHENRMVDLHSYIIKNNTQKVTTAHQLNQWIRGHNYFYVDFLMTLTYSSIDEIHRVIQFFKLNISLCVKYLQDFYDNFEIFIQNLHKGNNEHLDNIEVAYCWTFYQIFDMIYTITGSYQRLGQFFKENNDLLRKLFQVMGTRDVKQAYQLKIVEFFFAKNGFKLIQQILETIQKSNKMIPFIFLEAFAHLYSGISCMLQAKSRQTVVLHFRKITQKNISYFGDKQMKDFSQFQVIKEIGQILSFSRKTESEKSTESWGRMIELEIYFKMITCPYFEKKLRGITSFQQFIEKNVEASKEHKKQDIISSGLVAKWIEEKKLFDLLFAQDNPELIKKSTQLLKYLYLRDNAMEKYVILVWKYRQNKHETSLKQIYNLISEIPNSSNQQFTTKLFNDVLSHVNHQSMDSDYLKMIKDYTMNALISQTIKQSNSVTLNKNRVQKQKFGFKIIYQCILSNNGQLSSEILSEYIVEILSKIKENLFVQGFIIECFLSIKDNLYPNLHISLLLKILKQKITDLRVIELDCRQIIQQHIIKSKNSTTKNLQQQFQLLNEYLKQAKQIIPDEDFIRFWNQMIDSQGKIQFFKWLYKVKDSGKVVLTNFINLETKEFLLQNFWNVNYLSNHQVDESEAIFLLQLFKYVNQKEDNIRRCNLIFEVLEERLTGVNKLHQVYLNSEDQRVMKKIAQGLAEIYSCGAETVQNLKVNLQVRFINETLKLTQEFSEKNDIRGLKKMLGLIQELILRDEQVFEELQNIREDAWKTILVINLQNKEQKALRFKVNQNIYSIKKTISQKFNIKISNFDIIVNQKQILNYSSYYLPLSQLDKQGKILINHRQQLPQITKINLIEHLELLFGLLDKKEIEERVWNIVSKLPVSEEIRHKIKNAQNPVHLLGTSTSFYKELYLLKAAFSLQTKWWSLPSQTLIVFLLNCLQKTKPTSEITRQYLMVTGKLLQHIIKTDPPQNYKLFQKTFLSIYDIMKKIIIQSSQSENINLITIKKFLETFFAIGEHLNGFLVKTQTIYKEQDALGLMLNDPDIKSLLKLCLIENRHESIRKEFPVRLAQMAKNNKQRHAVKLTSLILDDLLDSTLQSSQKNFNQYMIFSCYCLQSMDNFLETFYGEKKSFYFQKIYKLIQIQEPQRSSQCINLQLQCYLSMIRCVLREVSDEKLEEFFIYLYQECLFKGKESKCKSKQTKNSVFNILLKIIKSNPRMQGTIYNKFCQLHRNGLWRTRRLEDWTIMHSERLKSPLNYVGLRNLGCICYMNSFFQQIFMISQFRDALLIANDPQKQTNKVQNNVLQQVKIMFLNLMYSDKKAYNPKSFCFAFKDYDGNPTNVNEQMDIDEFSGILLDRLQNQLKKTQHSSLIKDTFGGIYSNEIICKGCPHFSSTEESFLSLSLTVKDKKSIYESLQTMIKGDMLDGDNAYYCERCDKKVSATKRVCLKKLPNYLMVALKRFEFDYNTMTKLKLNGYCQFPQNLDLQPYSYDFLRKNKDNIDEQAQLKSKNYYQYKLKGVVIHVGYADSGHYYSLIQERTDDERWIEFNDTMVRKFNIQNLPDEAFGGETGGVQSKEKIKNAYLLIYERLQKIKSNRKAQQSSNLDQQQFINLYPETMHIINKENFEYNIQNILFSPQYIKFIQSLIEEAAKNKENISLQQFIILAFLTVISRSKTTPDMFEILKNIYATFCKDNQNLCEFVLELFSNAKIYEEFFRNCPIKEIKRNLAAWVYLLMGEIKNQKIKQRFLAIILFKITKENQNNIEALQLMYKLIDDEFCYNYLVENNLIGRILENIIRREVRFFGSVENLHVTDFGEGESFLGYEIVIEKSVLELKKIKYDNESGQVWSIIYKIINKYRLQELPCLLHPKEIEYLYLPRDKIYKLLEEVKTKFDIDMLTSFLCYLSHGNKDYIKTLHELIEKGLKQFQSKRYRQFFELFAKMLEVPDLYTKQRVVGIINILRSLKENQKYALDCTIIQLWICRIINQNELLRRYMISEKGILKYLSELALAKVPSDELSKKNIAFTENSVNKFHGIPFPFSRRGYIKILRSVEKFYQKLIVNEYEPITHFANGNHLVNEKLSPGDKIAYFDVKEKVDYEEAVVKEVFVDRLLILRKGFNRPFWIWNDDEKLTANLQVIKDQNSQDLDSSKTTEMEDQIDFQVVS